MANIDAALEWAFEEGRRFERQGQILSDVRAELEEANEDLGKAQAEVERLAELLVARGHAADGIPTTVVKPERCMGCGAEWERAGTLKQRLHAEQCAVLINLINAGHASFDRWERRSA